jgi:hypothetical protein
MPYSHVMLGDKMPRFLQSGQMAGLYVRLGDLESPLPRPEEVARSTCARFSAKLATLFEQQKIPECCMPAVTSSASLFRYTVPRCGPARPWDRLMSL